MALVMKCDRCGKYFDYDGIKSNAIKIIRYRNTDKSSFNYMNEFDLCPDCMSTVYHCLDANSKHD